MITPRSKLKMGKPRLQGMFLVGLACIVGPEPLVAQNPNGGASQWQAPARASRKPNPIDRSQESIAMGRTLFQANCVVCHGESGKGDGPSAATLVRPPRNLAAAIMWDETDGAVYWKIRNGNAPMPTFGASLTKPQIWHLVNFIRSLSADPHGARNESNPVPGTPPEFSVPADYLAAMSGVLSPYLGLEEALYADDLPTARKSALALQKAVSQLGTLNAKILPRRVLAKWLMTTRPLKAKAKAVAASEDLATMRQAFRTLSTHVVRAVRRFGHARAQAVQLYNCPIALGKVGVTWLQTEHKARNPYIGKGSHCGEVQEALGGGVAKITPHDDQGGSR